MKEVYLVLWSQQISFLAFVINAYYTHFGPLIMSVFQDDHQDWPVKRQINRVFFTTPKTEQSHLVSFVISSSTELLQGSREERVSGLSLSPGQVSCGGS